MFFKFFHVHKLRGEDFWVELGEKEFEIQAFWKKMTYAVLKHD